MVAAGVDHVIYLDYNATTPVDPAVLEAMLPYFSEHFGNASSSHRQGSFAAAAVDEARGEVADLLNVAPRELVFTSGATEANNLVFRGIDVDPSRNRILVGSAEHKSVLEAASTAGHVVDYLPTTSDGVVALDALDDLLDERVALVSVALANNETGVVNPMGRVAELAHGVGALVHSDITQAVGKIPVDVAELDIDLASASAHKVYGPKGVGLLRVGRAARVSPQVVGGGQERGLRSGTLNVPGIVGFGRAATLARLGLADEGKRLRELSALMMVLLEQRLGPLAVHGNGVPRIPNTMNVWLRGADAEAVIARIPAIAISTGSACSSSVPSPSHVLSAMHVPDAALWESVRISFGRPTSEDEVRAAAQVIADGVIAVRTLCDVPPETPNRTRWSTSRAT